LQLKRETMTYIKTLLFLLIVPGSVVFLVPYQIVRRSSRRWKLDLGLLRLAAWPCWAGGAALLLWSFWNFASRGRGTPHPADPPKELVAEGPYRLTRNPQYTGVMLIMLGHFLWSGVLALLAYGSLIFTLFNIFVQYYEEPNLEQRFGESYRRYLERVPRWLSLASLGENTYYSRQAPYTRCTRSR
jgi:protein-S-isoprenylcysteine O-methyltransferase Ste14